MLTLLLPLVQAILLLLVLARLLHPHVSPPPAKTIELFWGKVVRDAPQ